MATMKKSVQKTKDPLNRGQRAEATRLTMQGRNEARMRLKIIDEMKKANPGIRLVIPKKEEAELKQFMRKTNPGKRRAPVSGKRAAPVEPKEKTPKPDSPKRPNRRPGTPYGERKPGRRPKPRKESKPALEPLFYPKKKK